MRKTIQVARGRGTIVHQFLLVRPRSRNIASKWHSAILSSPPSIQTMVPDTFFFLPLYPKGCCIDRLNLPVLSCGLYL